MKKGLYLATSMGIGAARFSRVSKNAIIDAYLQSLAARAGHCDTPVKFSDVVADLVPTLRMRGDAIPEVFKAELDDDA